jgi:hypothetical protein
VYVKLDSGKNKRLAYKWRDELILPHFGTGVVTPQVGDTLNPDEWLLAGIDTETASESTGETLTLQYASDLSELMFIYGTDCEETALEDLLEQTASDLQKTNKRKAFITAHNLRFEINSIFRKELENLAPNTKELRIKREKYNITVSLGNPFFVNIRYRHGMHRDRYQILIRDSFHFFQSSLEEAGKTLGFNKLPKPESIGRTLTAEQIEQDTELLAYAMQDARVQHKLTHYIMQEFVVKSGLSAIPVSGSNFAAKAFRAHITEPYHLDLPAWAEQMAMTAYSGGLNWWNGQFGEYDSVIAVDFVSQYPFIMSQLPSLNTGNIEHVFTLDAALERPWGIYQITAEVLPSENGLYWLKKDGKTLSPGRYTWILTGYELKVAVMWRFIVVERLRGFSWNADSSGNELWSYIQKRFKIKSDKSLPKGQRDAAKLSMNALYGQFVHRRKMQNTRIVTDTETLEQVPPKIEEATGDITDIKTISQAGILFSPYYGALITGTGRAIIIDAALTLSDGDASNILYISTDGVGLRELKQKDNMGRQLGQLDVKLDGPGILLGERRYFITDGTEYICANHGMQAPNSVRFSDAKTVEEWYRSVLNSFRDGRNYQYAATRVHGAVSDTPNRFETVDKEVRFVPAKYGVG